MNQINSELKMPRKNILFLGFVAIAFFSVMFTTSLSAHNTAIAEIETAVLESGKYESGEIMEDRLEAFIDELKSKGVEIALPKLLLEIATVSDRHQLNAVTRIPASRILYHAQLADLIRVGIPEYDAQLLLLSHKHLKDEFTNENLSIGLISNSDIMKMKMEVDSYASANSVQTITLEKMKSYQRLCTQGVPIIEYGSLGTIFLRN